MPSLGDGKLGNKVPAPANRPAIHQAKALTVGGVWPKKPPLEVAVVASGFIREGSIKNVQTLPAYRPKCADGKQCQPRPQQDEAALVAEPPDGEDPR